MRTLALTCLVAAVVASGCGGSGGDRPELAGPAVTTTTQPTVSPAAPSATQRSPKAAQAAQASAARVAPAARRLIETQADVADAALRRWDAAFDGCIGPSGTRDDAAASCTHAAWDQLFDQMAVVHYELLALMGGLHAGPCRVALSSALDGIHGFLSGATPLEVVWLDEQQHPPSPFDLDAIVDVARPAAPRMRAAAATACSR